jgi:hypothetical protein
VRDGFSWWALASGFFAFVGLSIVIAGLEETRQQPDMLRKQQTDHSGRLNRRQDRQP